MPFDSSAFAATLALPRLRILAPRGRVGTMSCSCAIRCHCGRPTSSTQTLEFDHLFHGPTEPPTPSSSSVLLGSPSDVRTPSSAVSRRLGYFDLDKSIQTIQVRTDRHPPSIQLREPKPPNRRQVQSMYAHIAEPPGDHELQSIQADRPSLLVTASGKQTPSPSARVRPLPPPPARRERPGSASSNASSVPSLSVSASSANTSPSLSPRTSPQPNQYFFSPIEPLPSPWSSLDAPPQWQPPPRSSSEVYGSPQTARLRALPLPPDRPALARSKTSVNNDWMSVKSPTWSTAATEDAPRSASLWLSRSPRHGTQALQRAQSDATLSAGWTPSTPRQGTIGLSRERTVRRDLPSLPPPAQVPATASLVTPTSFAQAQQAGLARKRTVSVDERSLRRRGVAAFPGLAVLQELPINVERDLPPLPLE